MKNTLIFGVFLAVMVCVGTIAGCALTKSMTGSSPIQIVRQWREEDAGGVSKPVKPIKKDDSANKSPSKEKDDADGKASSQKENDAQDAAKDSASGKEEDIGKKVYKMGETWTVDGQWSLTVTGVEETSFRNEYYDGKDPGAVYVISYTYTNLGYVNPDGILNGVFFEMATGIVDSKGVMGCAYPADITEYPQEAPEGATCNAQSGIAVDNAGNFKITETFYDAAGTKQSATFEIDVSK